MRSHSTTIIPSFPSDIDRDAFGHWLSGFCDGEACFVLQAEVQRDGAGCRASLRIELRDDDTDILRLIQSYWNCGNLYARRERPLRNRFSNPHSQYVVSGWRTLLDVVIPHFQQFPLRAKKARDFIVWKAAVQFAYTVSLRRAFRSERGGNKKWSGDCLGMFAHYESLLNQGRCYPVK